MPLRANLDKVVRHTSPACLRLPEKACVADGGDVRLGGVREVNRGTRMGEVEGTNNSRSVL